MKFWWFLGSFIINLLTDTLNYKLWKYPIFWLIINMDLNIFRIPNFRSKGIWLCLIIELYLKTWRLIPNNRIFKEDMSKRAKLHLFIEAFVKNFWFLRNSLRCLTHRLLPNTRLTIYYKDTFKDSIPKL